jgi:hypothetical protein
MVNKKRPSKEQLRNLCIAHSQLLNARKEHFRLGDGSQLLLDMYDDKIHELENTIVVNLKSWLNLE